MPGPWVRRSACFVAVEAGPLDARQTAEVECLRGQIALDQRRGGEADRLLLSAARRLHTVSADLARATYLDALVAAIWAHAWAAAPRCAWWPRPRAPRRRDLCRRGARRAARRGRDAGYGGYAAAAPALTRALAMVLALDVSRDGADRWHWLAGGRIGQIIAMEMWDFESWQALAARQVQFSRKSGALMHLTFALNYLARSHILAGELRTAERLIEEDHLIAEATGNTPIADTAMLLMAWRGQEQEAVELVETVSREATERGASRLISLAAYANLVLYNGLGRSDVAHDAGRQAFEREPMGYGSHIVAELAESAARTGDSSSSRMCWSGCPNAPASTPTGWVLGIETRVRALLSEGEQAEGCYRESIERLGRTRVRAQLARAHLLYGEWLRRENRRVDARDQLRTAHEMLDAMGAAAFAERARRELLATGETVRKRASDTAMR